MIVRMVGPRDFRPSPGAVIGVDFGTYFAKGYSVRELGNHAYVHDPRFNAWAVSVTDGITACSCRPADFPWDRIDGFDWVSHNREFDRSVYERLRELGVCPAAAPRTWHCSAAACAFLQYPRDLAGACRAVLGAEVDKSDRASGKGVRGTDAAQATLFDTDMPEAECRHVAADAVMSHALWNAVGPLWPAHERRLFGMTCAMGRRGIFLDWVTVDAKRIEIAARAEALKASLPWKPALSPKKFAAAVRAMGVTPPDSTAADDEDFQSWVEDHAGTPPGQWAADVGQARRCGRVAGVLEGMQLRKLRDGRMAYELKYCGAAPGRWSGGGGLNVQNLNRKEAEGVELRKCVAAPPGHVLGVADYSQIEARVLLYLAGDTAALELLARHPEWDMYELHARATMGWKSSKVLKCENSLVDGEEGMLNAERTTPNAEVEREESLKDFCERTGSGLRQLAKARVLGLGFRCGAATFVRVARIMAGLKIDIRDAYRIVEEYRDSNPRIVRLWNRLEDEAAKALRDDPHEYRLAFPCTQADPRCGRYLYYRDVRHRGRGLEAVVAGERVPLHGGIIVENWTQGTARDVLASAWLRCANESFLPVLSVHDELVFELRGETAVEDLKRIVAILEKPLAWAPGLHLKASAKLMGRYGK